MLFLRAIVLEGSNSCHLKLWSELYALYLLVNSLSQYSNKISLLPCLKNVKSKAKLYVPSRLTELILQYLPSRGFT